MIPRMLNRCSRCGFFDEDLRTLDQNAKLWACLSDVASQVEWAVNGKMEKLTAFEWKDIFTASLKQHSRVAMGLDGGFVILGAHTSRMSKSVMSELLELILAFGTDKGVQWHERKAA